MKSTTSIFCLTLGLSIAALAQEPVLPAPEAQPASQEFQTLAPQEPVATVADSTAQPADSAAAPQASADSAASAPAVETAVTDSATADSQAVAASVVPDSAATAPADTAKPATVAAAPDTTVKADSAAVKPDSTAAAPAVVAAAPADTAKPVEAAPEIESPLDKILHGNAYNLVGNEAAAATVAGEMAIPHKMVNRNFAYFEPVDEEGVVSFGKGITYFFAFDNSNDLALVSAGLGMEHFGVLVQAAIGKKWSYIDDDKTGTEETIKDTEAGTAVGGTISAKLAGLDFAIRAAYDHPESESSIHGGDIEQESDIWNLGGQFLIARAGKTVSWTAGVSAYRYNAKSKVSERSFFEQDGRRYVATSTIHSTDSTARVEVIPEFNIGWAILRHEKGRVFMGMNTMVPLIAYDRIKNVCSRHNEYALTITPNILGEVMLGKYVVAFGSASHQWDIVRYRDSYINEVSTKTMDISSGITTANVGLRLEYEIAAIEMAFTKQFISNPFGAFSTTDEMATSIGMFINF
jgi:hypothetical protein